MSCQIHPASFALTNEGTVLINVGLFNKVRILRGALKQALKESTCVFVGVPLTPAEIRFALSRVDDIHFEAAGYITSARNRKRKRQVEEIERRARRALSGQSQGVDSELVEPRIEERLRPRQ